MPRQDSPFAAGRDQNRVIVLRDDTRRKRNLDKLGGGFMARFAFWDELTPLDFPKTHCPPGLFEPDNVRRDDLRPKGDPLDLRYSLQLISEFDHPFGGAGAPGLEGLAPPPAGAAADSGNPNETRERGVEDQQLAKLPTGGGLGGGIVDQPSTGGQTGIKVGFSGAGGSGTFAGLPLRVNKGVADLTGGATSPASGSGGAGTLAAAGGGRLGETVERGAGGGGGTVGRPSGGGGTRARGCDTAPGFFDAFNRSTRVVDQFPDVRGGGDDARGEALLVSTLAVIDDLAGLYSCATVVGPVLQAGGRVDGSPGFAEQNVDAAFGAGTSTGTVARDITPSGGGGSRLSAGYNFDGDKVGVWWSIVKNRGQDDSIGAGRRGTTCSLSGVRHDAHFEWDEHGRLYITPEDISGLPEAEGTKYKCFLAFDKTVANSFTQLGHETAEIRPVCVIPNFAPPVCEPVDATPVGANPGGTREEGGADGSGETTTAQLPPGGGGKTGRIPKDPGNNGRPVGYDIFYDPRSGLRVGLDTSLTESAPYGMAMRVGAEYSTLVPAGNADKALTGGLIGDLVVANRKGPATDLSVLYVYGGDGTGTPTAGMTLPDITKLGTSGANSPNLIIGNTGESPHWRVRLLAADGNLEVTPLAAGGGSIVASQQAEFFTSVHLQGPETGDTSRSWNVRDESAGGGYGQVSVLDAVPVSSFARQDFYRDISGGAHVGPIGHFVRTKGAATLFGVRYHANVDMLRHTSVAAGDVPTPAAGDSILFLNSSNSDHASRKDSAGVVTDIEGGGSGGASSADDLTVNNFRNGQQNLDWLNSRAARARAALTL